MPNLAHVQALHKRYKPQSEIAKLGDVSSFLLKESLNPDRLEKAFLTISNRLGPEFETYFDMGSDADVALLFIDICSFSTRYAQLSSEDLSTFLDAYYERLIPIIYEHGGEIDRIMGDGIIAIFGPPFLKPTTSNAIIKALACSLKTIVLTTNTKFFSKIALHAGKIRYYRNKSTQYPEYTIIGKPVTELYRLESISCDNSITYYSGSLVDQSIEHLIEIGKLPVYNHRNWICTGSQPIISSLKGVDFNHIKHIQHL
ncbi:hypothetical protein F5984_24445 [Rudanella paleaurantiibacter]|uniref:Guanylate cyclase domain-containing protein n=1 Tax=Rudanella paleaurantiibacter TaxID=2614655 RepID=A0A7J5TSS0_9BACT|nr:MULTISPECIES: adenylate/guanylate cyclase domain-containing protein [Rudanella]KAB7726472.1 hypothetical protein F5984_24445 [Rudanella paleaurantiibacter]